MAIIKEEDCVERDDGTLICLDRDTGKLICLTKSEITTADVSKEELPKLAQLMGKPRV
jgi:hypothetical protein